MVAILAGAAVLRFFDLAHQPGGLYPDEAAEGLDAIRLLREPAYHPLFFPSDAGREPVFAYITSLSFRLFGMSTTTLRGTAAAIGVLGVLATYLALRRFGNPTALFGALWSAGTLWLIAISRDGFRDILVVPVGALALWALLRWNDRPSRVNAVIAGAIAGAGLWTYQPLKLLPLLIAAWLVWMSFARRGQWTKLRGQVGWLAVSYLVVAAPMLWVAATEPALYFGRAAGVTPFGTAGNVIDHTLRTLAMFFVAGDPNPRHNVAGLPMLGAPLSLIALLGLWRAWRKRCDPAHALLLLGSLVFLLPPLVAVEGGAPHFLRSLGLAPYVAALVGLGCSSASDITSVGKRASAAILAGLSVLIVTLSLLGERSYLARPEADRYSAYEFNVVNEAIAARQSPTAIVISDFDGMVVRFVDVDQVPLLVDPKDPVPIRPGLRVIRQQ